MKRLLLVGTYLSLLMVSAAEADNCFNVARSVSRSYIAQSYVAPSYVAPVQAYAYYFVGAPIRQQALAQTTDPMWQEFQEFQEFKRWKQQQGPESLPLQQSVLGSKCLQCHSDGDPDTNDNGVNLAVPFTPELTTKVMGKVWRGEMPPNAPLDSETAAALFDELLGRPEGR